MGWFADRFPTLAKHGAVLKESWRQQGEADKAFKPKSDHEFLPAALEIMEKPPSVGLRRLLLLLCALFVIALAWSIFGRVDVVATAGGKTIPSGSIKVIQPIEIGAIRKIHVKNGQYVRKGDILVELDPTLASADTAQSTQTLLSAQVIKARNKALIDHMNGRPARFVAPAGTPADIVANEQAFVRTAIAEFNAERAGLQQQRAEKISELAGAEAELAKLRETLPYLDKQMTARTELAEKGYFSKLRLLEYEQQRAEHIRNIDVQSANAERARAAIRSLEAQALVLRERFGKTAVTDLAEASDRATMAGEELTKSAKRQEYQILRAPVDGVVQQMVISTVGGVVQPAQSLMVIVPCAAATGTWPDPARCKSAVEVEVFVQNKDIGFIKAGQKVAVKVEAFNFTDFGLIDGTVDFISRDAIDMSQQPAGSQQDERGRPAQQGLVYAARIRLECAPTRKTRAPLCDRVQPGMSVQAEIKTGQRRIIQYLLSPISKAMDEAGRER
ncbi:HlyD family type I secretion periplasmic adaptor subunit [Sphingorhabdus arenilitoris]|uniref:Membrane fusion protein (MFP) family protein n=1 Tax=Sphingorhabdus arenilitoris TaxID=1490041 RepID=A0ABV8RDN1_9SPHN